MAANLRIKCPNCKKVENAPNGTVFCTNCGTRVVPEAGGTLYLYRQGSPIGIAGGFGIYINGEPYGHIGNRELLRIPLPYGTYNLHCAAGMNRECTDMIITFTPQANVTYIKVSMKMGAWTNKFILEPVDPNLLEF